jgi:uncharacterized membrane protein YesL
MKWITYTPQPYTTKEEWQTYKKYFILIQIIPFILPLTFEFLKGEITLAFVTPGFVVGYFIWTVVNIGIFLLAVYESKKYAHQLKRKIVIEN